MAESVPHFVELGWSEAKCGGVQVWPDGGVDIPHDGPTRIVIHSMIPRPPTLARPGVAE
jgi:hypothetical protein